ncbi:MAG: hypothetical protein V3W19_06935, partial [Desulfatiglandales bacterium]
VHRRDAEGAESYLFLLSAERPESKRTQPSEADKYKPYHNSSFSRAYSRRDVVFSFLPSQQKGKRPQKLSVLCVFAVNCYRFSYRTS